MTKTKTYDNWELLIKECEGLYGQIFFDRNNDLYEFFGLVHTDEDYYYGMMGVKNNKLRLLSCVGNLESHDFTKDPQ